MRILVIPDVHLKAWMFDRAEEIIESGKADTAVCLMDLADDWDMSMNINAYAAVYDRAIAFAKKYPDSLWVYGNHDISYIWAKYETGYSPYAEATVISKMNELENLVKRRDENRMGFVLRADNVLFAHGGLTVNYLRSIDPKLIDADVDDVLETVNHLSAGQLWSDHSPLWHRPQVRRDAMYGTDRFVQVVGHTPVETITLEDGVLSTDVFSTYRDGTMIGEPVMVVIDSVTKAMEKIQIEHEKTVLA